MTIISFQELQTTGDELIARIQEGEAFVVTRDGMPFAELRPIPVVTATLRPYGLCAGAFSVPDDFDAPLPEELLREFEGT